MRKLFLPLILLACLYAASLSAAVPGASLHDGPRFEAGVAHHPQICNDDAFDNDDDDPGDSMLAFAGVIPNYAPHDSAFSLERFIGLNESLLPDHPSIALSSERGPPSRLSGGVSLPHK